MGENGKREVTFEGEVATADAIAYIQSLLSGLKKGTVCVQQGSRYLTVHPGNELALAVRVKSKSDKESFCIELSWKREMNAKSSANGLQITDHEPTAAPVAE
jgi:amphi-Trp domain-containing protein